MDTLNLATDGRGPAGWVPQKMGVPPRCPPVPRASIVVRDPARLDGRAADTDSQEERAMETRLRTDAGRRSRWTRVLAVTAWVEPIAVPLLSQVEIAVVLGPHR